MLDLIGIKKRLAELKAKTNRPGGTSIINAQGNPEALARKFNIRGFERLMNNLFTNG